MCARESVLYLGQGGGTQIGDERIRLSGVSQAYTVTYSGDIREGLGVVKQFEFHQTWVSGLIGDDGMLHHLVNGNSVVALRTMKSHIQKLRWMVRLGGTPGPTTILKMATPASTTAPSRGTPMKKWSKRRQKSPKPIMTGWAFIGGHHRRFPC